ncbi:C69 family dipeptidase [Enterococcus sp. LJL99]
MCTTVLVGKKASIDGSTMIARNCDYWLPLPHLKFVVVSAEEHQKGIYHSYSSKFKEDLPEQAMRYQMAPLIEKETEGIYGEAGFNEENIAMSATESLYGNERVLGIDPFLESGLGEDSLLTMILPYIHTAREGVELVGKMIEKHGSHEGNGVIFSDKDEIWYMEIPCGHHWVAQRIPEDHCAVIANQVSQQTIDFDDPENFMWSKNIQEFVEENQLNPDSDNWNFRHIFGTNAEFDHQYNTPRVWYGQKLFGVESADRGPRSDELPFTIKPNRKLGHEDVANVLSSHYNETVYDQLGEGSENERKKFRPIAIYRTLESHILQIRNNVPKEIAAITWFNSGVTAYNPYVPFYANATDTAPGYRETSLSYDGTQAYWQARNISVLVERSFEELHTIDENYLKDCVQTANAFIHETDQYVLKENPADITAYLTDQNAKIASKISDKSLATIGLLVDNGLALSKLTFNMDKNIL